MVRMSGTKRTSGEAVRLQSARPLLGVRKPTLAESAVEDRRAERLHQVEDHLRVDRLLREGPDALGDHDAPPGPGADAPPEREGQIARDVDRVHRA
jgi:hypothetical protein